MSRSSRASSGLVPTAAGARLVEEARTLLGELARVERELLAPDHPLAARDGISATELARETVYAHDAPRADVERLREIVAGERAAMPRVVSVPLTSLLVDCVRAGRLVSR